MTNPNIRTDLAEPEPPADGEVADLEANFRAWYQGTHGSAYFGAMPLCVAIGWAQHLLQQATPPAPAPPATGEVAEGPSDEELDELAWNWFSKTGSTWWQIEGFRAFARAVLARWGR